MKASRLFLLFFTICLLAIGFLAIRVEVNSLQEDVPAVDPRFGAIESFWAADEAAELGVGWERILFYWNEIQPEDADDWNTLHVLEEWLVEAEKQDRIVVGLLKNTPAWATDDEPFSGVPRGLYLPPDHPSNLWANYIRRIVQYYGPRGVHNWIIWNEPEIEPGVYGHEFGGTVEDYARLLEVAYLVAKEHDPQAVIHLAGYSYWHDPAYLEQLFEVITDNPDARDHNHYFDVISLHIYFRVETVAELVRQTDEIQEKYGLEKPIWVNETNAAPNLDPWWPVERPQFQIDLDQQAWYIIQAHALGFGAGAERIGVYKLIDILLPEGGESFGILRPDYSPRPAYLAYKATIDNLSGFQQPVDVQEERDYFVATFERPQGITRVLWARRDRAVTLKVPALVDSAFLVNFLGEQQGISADNGFFTLTLEGARCRESCDIGGPPVFLYEAGVTLEDEEPLAVIDLPLLATLTATPEVTATFTPWPTPTDTPTATPTDTPTPTATNTPTSTPTATDTPTATPTSLPIDTPVPSPTVTGMTATLATTVTPASPITSSSLWLVGGVIVVLAAGLILILLRRER
ncbi:MAG: hypothetical protein R3293_17995 [Candidatus Promineifilaceae bacterium]|nr:hypothetical protein [Candidatus Promineifilaceae bacterium]